jgi:hypothetical protein
VACHDLASLRVTGERNPRLLTAGPPGWLRVQGREGALSAPGEGAGLGAESGAAEVAVGGGVALAAESARWPYGELCWPADRIGAPTQRASGAPRSRLGRVSGASNSSPRSGILCGAGLRARGAFDNPAGPAAVPAFELAGPPSRAQAARGPPRVTSDNHRRRPGDRNGAEGRAITARVGMQPGHPITQTVRW